jgi:hypothetical protein
MPKKVLNISGDIPEVWVVERIDAEGEELPVLRHSRTWMLAPLALRYVLRTRFHLGPSSLFTKLRGVCILYNWAESAEGVGDLETFLTSGGALDKGELLRVVTQLRRQHNVGGATPTRIKERKGIVSNSVFNRRLSGVGEFLEWAMEPGNHGGEDTLDDETLEAQISKTVRVLKDSRLSVSESPRHEPLTPLEIEFIRRAIKPDEFGQFPVGIFSECTRYRNWSMFETALGFGTRKGEMLTLKVIHLQTGTGYPRLLIPRQQDEAEDPRNRRRLRGKTNERFVEASDKAVLSSILKYRDDPPPIGRNSYKIKSAYLFVVKGGRPIASSTADYVIKKIGEYAARLAEADRSLDPLTRQRLADSLRNLSWHRLRHTWAENAAEVLYEKYEEGAWAILKEWGGWNSSKSVEHYIRNARRKIAFKASLNHLSSFEQRSSQGVRI